jgi:hypothetical protein
MTEGLETGRPERSRDSGARARSAAQLLHESNIKLGALDVGHQTTEDAAQVTRHSPLSAKK